MKKIITILLCGIMMLSLFACTQSDKSPASYTDLIVKLDETVHGMFADDFEDKLAEGAYPSPTGELSEKWMETLYDAKADFRNVDENAFGYKLIDINSDGVSELFFMRSDERILAIFTMYEGKPCMVDCYDRDYRGVIRDTGEVYTLTVREDGGYDYKIYTLNPSSGGLYNTVAFGLEGYIAYEMIEGSVYTTSSDRINELQEEYPFEMSEVFTELKFNLF
ncbi:MAG: hypothetical protein IKU19_08490 [Clostridia bacterium]|nr:hypothetical protein [Clostridia bacterium]